MPLCGLGSINLLALLALLLTWEEITRAANVLWQPPSPIAADCEIITNGSLERAYVMGYGRDRLTVNGVSFARFGANSRRNQGQENISDGQTLLTIGGEDDRMIADLRLSSGEFAGISSSYQALLRAGVHNEGSPWALIINGLTVGKTYCFQTWLGNRQTPKTVLALGGGTNSVPIDTATAVEVCGTFVADGTSQAIIYTPIVGTAQMYAFQLRVINETSAPVAIIKQPSSTTVPVAGSARLAVLGTGNPTPKYQWQRVNGNHVRNLVDDTSHSGTQTSVLRFSTVNLNDAGEYQVVMANSFNSVTSSIVTLTVSTQQLINVAVSGADPVAYRGKAVLPGNPDDVWNSVDARTSFTNVPLKDATGSTTPVTLSLTKGDGTAISHALLGGISFAPTHVVTINNLLPNEAYDLVVFSVGGKRNEGGVFSGAVMGIACGYDQDDTEPTDFIPGVNYVENQTARSDANGTLSFTIKANDTAMRDGYFNSDFNGLQLARTGLKPPALAIVKQPPAILTAYQGQAATLLAVASGPKPESLQYQWQKVTATGTSNLADDEYISGAHSNLLTFKKLRAADDGHYQLNVSHATETITSQPADIQVLTNQLINIMVTDNGPMTYRGMAVLRGTPEDIWNRVDARAGFADAPLVDSRGVQTPATLSLFKSDGFCVPHPLLGAISHAKRHTVTINHLSPNEFYALVAFSAGGEPFEGGVFSGAVNGMARGYPSRDYQPSEFLDGINYVENPYAMTDAQGTLTFSIAPNSTVLPEGFVNGDFNGLQLMKVTLADHPPIITGQPESARAYQRHAKQLSVKTVGPMGIPTFYQWQKIAGKVPRNLTDGNNLSGANTSTLNFNFMTLAEAGDYQVVASNMFGTVTSQVATLTLASNQLINVAVSGERPVNYRGIAVFSGTTNDAWNSVDARRSFKNVALFDATGALTPVTLTLSKSEGDAIPHELLGGISYATNHVVTINNLLPDEFYDLVVFSVGSMRNEGGVFSGAVTGMASGYEKRNTRPTEFIPGVNYVENQTAHSDAHGTLIFTIKPNATAMPGGYVNGDFNGLQIIEGMRASHASPADKVVVK